jgi:hypothetical protein
MIYTLELYEYFSKKLMGFCISIFFIYAILKAIGISIFPGLKVIFSIFR